jgi:hypothetical protein
MKQNLIDKYYPKSAQSETEEQDAANIDLVA